MLVKQILLAGLLLAGLAVLVPAQQPGPSRRRPVSIENEEPVTFNKQVVRLLQDRCQTCHHPGDIAPFSLITYQDAYDHKGEIRYQTENRIMPPWHVNSECAAYQDNPSLTSEEIRMLRRWVDSGAPEGNPVDLSAPLKFNSGWSLGQPDMILAMDEPMTPDFSKGDMYRCFVLPTNLDENRYVSAAEVLPGSRAMVHHVLLFVDSDPKAPSQHLDSQDPGPGYTCFGGPGFSFIYALGGWAPGNRPKLLPDGVGMMLPKNSRVVMQVHYSARSGKQEADRTSVGLYFSKTPVKKTLLALPIINTNFKIPAGESNYKVTASLPNGLAFLPADVHLLGVTPHMHLLGKKMTVTAIAPDKKQLCLVDVPNWDFHWQGTYFYEDPIVLKTGTRINLTAYYDNSENNPENPNNPPRDVGWGENTTDEMCIAFLHFTLDAEVPIPGLAKTTLDSFARFWEVDLAPRRHGLAGSKQ
ncbi:MAG TPA: ascorbate-dependent monooxygenase [Acidobacteriota bacterium]|nr:ascorbate-dependent monooxygenase [Acidobacteriota bacterium]